MDLVADASAILCAVFPDEASEQARLLMKEYALGNVDLFAPRLILLELLNSCLVAGKRNRIAHDTVAKLSEELSSLQINWVDVEDHPLEIFDLCCRFNVSAYDAAYILAAKLTGCGLLTADRRLYNAVKEDIPFVRLIDDFK